MSLRDKILTANDLPKEPVSLPSWDLPYPDPANPGAPAQVYVATLSGEERDAFEESITEQKGKKVVMNKANIRAKLAVRCAVDSEGKRIFTDADAKELGKKSSAELQSIFNIAMRLNKFSDEDIEELAKNS